MKAHPSLLALVLALGAGSNAWAQSIEHDGPSGDGAATDAAAPVPAGYVSFPNERHLVFRVMGGTGLRLGDLYSQGLLLPPFLNVDAALTLVNLGAWRMGPSIGGQLGFDPAGAGTQGAIVPGWSVLFRPTPAFGLTLRLGIPVLITRGPTGYDDLPYMDQPPVPAPLHHSIDVGFGTEVGVGAAYYLTAGFALTAEASGGVYFGDSFYTFPYAALGLGVLIDYELLP